MTQSIFGGATSYEEQSLDDIKEDILKWIDYTQKIQVEMNKRLKTAQENGYWEKIGFDFQMTIYSSISFFQTILDDLTLIYNAINQENITVREVKLLRKIGQNAVNYNINEYPKSYKGYDNYLWHDYGNLDFENIENMYAHGRDFFVTLQDAENAASRLDDYMDTKKIINNTMNINGNINNTQIQQGTIDASQSQEISNDFDYSKALEILLEINKHTSSEMFNQTFKDNADELRRLIEQAILCAQEGKKESTIQSTLKYLLNLASNVTAGVMSSGIVHLIKTGFPLF